MEITDTHTLFIRSKIATSEQIRIALDSAIADASSILGRTIATKIIVNLVKTPEGKSCGYAYVYVSNPEAYHILLGRNPNGSERVEMRDDPSWVAPKKEDFLKIEKSSSWADICDEEDSLVPRKIEMKVGPLVTIPNIPMTKEQIAIPSQEKMAHRMDISKDYIELEVTGATVRKPGFKTSANILKSRFIPDSVTGADIRDLFVPVTTDSSTLYDFSFRRQIITGGYPFVFFEGKDAYVVFDPDTNDALFSLHILKKVVLKKDKESITLVFFNATDHDREIVDKVKVRPHQGTSLSIPEKKASPRNKGRDKKPSISRAPPTPVGNKFSLLPDD